MKAEKIRILIVDDELLIRDLLYDYFSNQGYAVTVAEDGRQALDYIEQYDDIRVVLADLKMPVTDGLEVAREVNRTTPWLPIIIMTAYPSMHSAIESIHNSVFDYLVKPFKMTELDDIVNLAIKEAEFRREKNYAVIKEYGKGGKR